MLRLPDRSINVRQLGAELGALGLPGFLGVARLSRDVDGRGKAILKSGAAKKIAPYILIKCGDISQVQEAAVRAAVADHVPAVRPPKPPRFEDTAQSIEAAGTLDELKTAVAAVVRSL